jgi:hypothetical protein
MMIGVQWPSETITSFFCKSASHPNWEGIRSHGKKVGNSA